MDTTMLRDLHQDVIRLGESVQRALAQASRALLSGDKSAGEDVLAGDDLIDRMELGIAQGCGSLLSLDGNLQPEERRELVAILRLITDLERTADLAGEIALICRDISPPHPAKIADRLAKLAELASNMVQTAMQAFADRDPRDLLHLREQEGTVDVIQRLLHAEILCHLRVVPGSLKVGISLMFASHDLGRIAAHATSIGESVIYSLTGQLGRLRNYRPSDYPASLLPLV